MAYLDNYQLAGDDRDRLLQEIMASRQPQATQPDPEVVKQIATEMAAVQQPQQVETAPQVQPAQVQQRALPTIENGLAGAAAQFTPLDTMGRIVGRQIYDLKGGYDDAAKAGDMEAAKRFADAANNIRDYGQKYGVDVSRFGSDVTRDQLGTLLQADAARGIQDMQNMKTSQEYFYEAKQRYLDQGVSDRRATQMAIDETRRYEGEYARKMASAMINYGVNDQSEMNKYAPYFAQMLYNNDPQSMAVFDAYQVNPKEQWKQNKEIETAGYLNGLRIAAADRNYEHTRQLKQDDYAFRDAQGDKARGFQANQAAQQHAFKKDLAAWAAGLDVDKQEALLQLAAKYGMDPADIFGKRGGGSSGNRDTEPPKQEAIAIQNIQDLYNKGRQTLSNVQETINEMERIKEKISDPDTRSLIQDMEYALNAEREGVSWNDHGQSGDSQNFIDYYEAVKNHPELVKHLEKIYEAAKASKSGGGGNY